ncbi:MAG TPA: hypothetical protein VHR64_01640 [Thermomicrobiales bacterium]|nr:hypothetical protein [Thermomicrobiales bacterium]
MERDSPCRLFVYLAREAPVGVVLRRGPSDWVRLSLWHTDADRFEHGQWMRARVFERRSDLSADGSLFVAFVRGSAGPSQGNTDTWAALSRPPWFTALALWFVGGTYYTGGYFPERGQLWLGWDSPEPDQGRLPEWLKMTSERPPYIDGTNDWTDRTVWMNRLLRDGWTRREGAEPETWERSNPAGDMTLAMRIVTNIEFRAYGGRHVIEYAVQADPDEQEVDLGRATWADWDQRGRLIVARDGRLLHWQPSGVTEIADFNDQSPDPQPAPSWATTWPRRL